MRATRLLTAPLTSPRTYQRWAYLIIGGALFLPYLMATLVPATLLTRNQEPSPGPGLAVALVLALILAAATAALPRVRTVQAQAAAALLGAPLPDSAHTTATTWRSTTRAGAWLALHAATGFTTCMATMVVLTEAALLALTPLADTAATLAPGPLTITGERPLTGHHRLLGPLYGALLLAAFLYLIALAGTALAGLAPLLLGPSAADRLAAAQAQARDLSQRNRLARELHDSIGHALSVVALHAATAARLLEHDPDFARQALNAIADQARTATAELDHALGLLRQEHATTAPAPDLADLPHLIEATTTTGADTNTRINGRTDRVPALVSREAYRICQEGITNALRHGAPAPLALTLDIGARHLDITLANPLPPKHRHRGRTGRGLAGMTERVHLLGGRLHTRTHQGHWYLNVHLPWKEAP